MLEIGDGTITGSYKVSLHSHSPIISGQFNIGFDTSVYNPTALNSGRAIGVRGLAGYSTNGYNYGVLGQVWGTQDGAGIFGTISNNIGIRIPGRYAGYFDGRVCVSGDLTVNGNINGVILGETVSKANVATAMSVSTEKVSDKLSGLSAVSFYKQRPATVNNVIQGDTIEAERTIPIVEAQSIEKPHYALSLEDVEAVYPELVYNKEDGTKGINYMEMIPLLVQSVSELKAEVTALKAENTQLKAIVKNGQTDNGSLYIDMGGRQIKKNKKQ